MKRTLLAILCLAVFAVLCIGIHLFFIGEPVDGIQLICKTDYESQTLTLDISCPDSAIALHSWKFRQEGSILYIRARKVLVSPFFSSGHYHTSIDTSVLTDVYLGGQRIWSVNSSIQ